MHKEWNQAQMSSSLLHPLTKTSALHNQSTSFSQQINFEYHEVPDY